MTYKRKNFNKLIDPNDIAEFVRDLITKYPTFQVSDTNIFKNYKLVFFFIISTTSYELIFSIHSCFCLIQLFFK